MNNITETDSSCQNEHPDDGDDLNADLLEAASMEEQWDFQRELTEDKKEIDPKNEYIKMLRKQSKLVLLQKARAKKALRGPHEELGLFYLFFTMSFWDTIRLWTNKRLAAKGLPECTKECFAAYLGLEIGMSLVRFNTFKEYWSTGLFVGHQTFSATMSRNVFQQIRANLFFYNPSNRDDDVQHDDPLWHSRNIMEHFVKNSSAIAVPVGTSALDENTARTKARTKARTYMPNKPDKYGVRFYTVCGTQHCYVSNINDNRAGNTTGYTAAADFCRVFGELRTPCRNIIQSKTSKIDATKASALWVLQMGLQTKRLRDPSGRRVFFTDNFYTRHNLAMVLSEFTDGEGKLIGTVKYTNVDATNRYYLFKAMEQMKDAERGSWCLVRA
jgi:hypothetical protein